MLPTPQYDATKSMCITWTATTLFWYAACSNGVSSPFSVEAYSFHQVTCFVKVYFFHVLVKRCQCTASKAGEK